MSRLTGVFYAAFTALIIALAPIPSAQAAPLLMGGGNIIRDTVPESTEQVRRGGRGGFRGGGFRGHRGFRGGFHRGPRFHRPYYGYRGYGRPYRPAFAGPAFYGSPYGYGARCFIRPARYVPTPYGYQLRPARRICRY
ncbi:MAG: hypothetical protein ACRCWF_17490 [Beijerinckiaceae bacterium]